LLIVLIYLLSLPHKNFIKDVDFFGSYSRLVDCPRNGTWLAVYDWWVLDLYDFFYIGSFQQKG